MGVKKGLMIGVVFAFFVMGFIAMKQAMPAPKEARIYKAIELYSPYKFKKKMSGLEIIDTRDGHKEDPSSADVMLRFDELNKKWGHKHLKVIDNKVVVLGDNNQTVSKIFIKTQKERAFLQKFYGI